jgi:hypothetical protein
MTDLGDDVKCARCGEEVYQSERYSQHQPFRSNPFLASFFPPPSPFSLPSLFTREPTGFVPSTRVCAHWRLE